MSARSTGGETDEIRWNRKNETRVSRKLGWVGEIGDWKREGNDKRKSERRKGVEWLERKKNREIEIGRVKEEIGWRKRKKCRKGKRIKILHKKEKNEKKNK